ncbi:YbaK/EbsC family protein [Vibrio sp. CAU 1672]|uniref:aminoacyl-tRNA deacylase n=1 Tax=Vibrio sp. CAU 1672 TaxID=3032594 RepID=UPI0023DAA88E|nr:YbaK/EbsC family protein [Vibrio sp. CAU 1672]MDF2154109.1 YbaK/EbsC family protein [Vibrio sp. CAU 1672]
MSKPLHTPLMQFLTERRIPFRLLPHQTPATSIDDAARQRGIRPSQMVKAMLLRDMDNDYALACAPGNRSVDPKKVRALLQCRRMTCVDQTDVEIITGYPVGTVTPLLLKTPMPIIFDPSLLLEREVTISSGDRMAGLALSIKDLLRLCQPTLAEICRP